MTKRATKKPAPAKRAAAKRSSLNKPAKTKPAKKSAKKSAKKPAKKPANKPTTLADLDKSIRKYASGNYRVTEVRFARCSCDADVFDVQHDDEAGCARRTCASCGKHHLICDSAEYWDEADPEGAVCRCWAERFQVAVGFAFFAGTTDVRWLYLGLRCVACGLAGVYADWKIDYSPSHQLLEQV